MKFKNYRIIFKVIERKCDNETAREVRRAANAYWDTFESTVNSAKNKVEKLHLTQIAEGCAVYLALKERFPSVAYKWMDRAVEIEVSKKGKSLDAFTRIPYMKYVFIKMAWKVASSIFGEKAGFENRLLTQNKEMVSFEMLKCPYCKYCKEFGCEELTRLFCDSDEYAYKNLKNIEFIRTKTLGIGGDCCDFCYKVK